MKLKELIIILCGAAQLATAQVSSEQGSSTSTPIKRFGKSDLSDVLTRTLLLTNAQQAQLRPYLDTIQSQLDVIDQQERQAEDLVLKELNGSIRPSLTPEQQTKLDLLEAMRIGGPPSNHIGIEPSFGKDFRGLAQ